MLPKLNQFWDEHPLPWEVSASPGELSRRISVFESIVIEICLGDFEIWRLNPF